MESTMEEKRGTKTMKKSAKTRRKKDVLAKMEKREDVKSRRLTVDDIKGIGGNEDDLKLIGDVSGSDEEYVVEDLQKEVDIDPQELQSYIKNLGFKNMPSTVSVKSSKSEDDTNIKETAKDQKTVQHDTGKEQEQRKLTKQEKKAEKKQKMKKSEPSTSAADAKTPRATLQGGTESSKLKSGNVVRHQGPSTDVKDGGRTAPAAKKAPVLQHAEVSSTSAESKVHQGAKKQISAQKLLDEFTPRRQLLFEPDGLCYYQQFPSDPKTFEACNDASISAFKALASRLYYNEVQIYTSKKQSDVSTRAQWMKTVVSSGVLGDKVAALTLQVQTAPVHSTQPLDSLMAMVKKKGRREALVAMDTLRQLFQQELLPERRKLMQFSQHPFLQLDSLSGGNPDERNKRLMLWYYEDQLKYKYQEFVITLEKLSHDTIHAVKQKAMSTSLELLTSKPEQEKALLTLLVNKIGDPDYKIAARAVHLLQKLVETHTNMKGVVVTEVETLLYRANVSPKAQYYAICFLNQLILSHEEPDLATKLIVVYFSFFKACMKKQDVDQKMLGAVLTGVNRAYPYSDVGDERVSEQTDALFKVVHIAPFNAAVQALLLLKQVLDTRQSISDRFYSALYSKLLDRNIEHSPRQAMFLNLLFQSLKADTIIGRIKAFVKRLLQACSTQQPPFICGALFLVSEIMDLNPSLRNVAMDAIDSDDEEHFVDIDEDEETEGGNQSKKDADKDTESKSSWVHHMIKNKDKKTVYDPANRNPQFCGAEGSVFWELTKLENHYHPSVALFAKTLRDGLKVHYMGNPLKDFTQMRFLDRFVYKNPKKQPEKVKNSIMEPKGKSYKPSAIRLMAVNTRDYLKTAKEKIPIDEMFFHKYFTSKGKKPETTLEEEKGTSTTTNPTSDEFDFDSDASSVDDDEFDRILGNVDLDEEEEDDDDLDFAGEVSRKKDKTKTKKGRATEEDSSDDDDDFNDPGMDDGDSDVGDEDFDDDDEEDGFQVENEEFDEEGFGESDDDNLGQSSAKAAKSKKATKRARSSDDKDQDSDDGMDFLGAVGAGKKKIKKKRRKGEVGGGQSTGASLQSTAEEFSSLMDEHVGAKFDSIGLNAMANKDNADAKQLNWEIRRDKWIQGRDPKSMMLAKKKQGRTTKGKAFKKGPERPMKKGGRPSGGKTRRGKRASKKK